MGEKEAVEEKEVVTARQYVCNTWKSLHIGAKVKFVSGFFETDDPDLQQLIESRDSFGVSIHFQDTLEVMEARGRAAAEAKHSLKAKRRQELLDEFAEDERVAQARRDAASREKRDKKEAEDVAKMLRAADKVANPKLEPEQPKPQTSFGGVVEPGKHNK